MGGELFDLAIVDGTVVGPSGRSKVDLYVSDGRISSIEDTGQRHSATRTVNASGLLVLPGFVDTHVHLMEPGDPSREDFETGTRAAVTAGVTTIIEHTHGWPVTSVDRLHEKRAHVRGRSWIDYGLAAHAWDHNLDQVPALWAEGISFLKMFTCETHGVPAMTSDLMFDYFETLGELGAMALVHCEDDLMTANNERRLRRAGRFDGGLLSEWRSREAELVAIGSTVLLARLTGARINIAHVSNHAALELVTEEQAKGADVLAETCPQYLTLHEEEALMYAPFRKFTPPARLRSRREERRMWDAVDAGRVGLLSSDHAPSTPDQKRDGTLWDVHFGLPGLDTTSSILLDAAISGHLSFESLVRVYSRRPADRYGLTGKGRIAPGWDADVVLIDPNTTRTLTAETVISRAGWTPYEGREVDGRVVSTFLRGVEIVSDGVLADIPVGRFLPGPGSTSGRET